MESEVQQQQESAKQELNADKIAQAVLAKLGVSSLDELKEALAKAKEPEAKKKEEPSETDKLRAEYEEAQKRLSKAEAKLEAANLAIQTSLRRAALAEADVIKDAVPIVLAYANAQNVDPDKMEAFISDLKKKLPFLFKGSAEATSTAAPPPLGQHQLQANDLKPDKLSIKQDLTKVSPEERRRIMQSLGFNNVY